MPCIVSDIRGNKDLIDDGKGGYLIEPHDPKGFSDKINLLIDTPSLRNNMLNYNLERIKDFKIDEVKGKIYKIFKNA